MTDTKKTPPIADTTGGENVIKFKSYFTSKRKRVPPNIKGRTKEMKRALEFVETQGEIKERALRCQAQKK